MGTYTLGDWSTLTVKKTYGYLHSGRLVYTKSIEDIWVLTLVLDLCNLPHGDWSTLTV